MKGAGAPDQIRTERLLLRRWCPSDLDPFAAMNADPRVAEHFPSTLTWAESAAVAGRIREHWLTHGFGVWVVELPGEIPFVGAVGLSVVMFEAPFTPCVEVSWRLAGEHWGRGFATESAAAAVRVGFGELGLREILAFTVPQNLRSLRVMQKLGMRHDAAGDFDHPRIPPGHPLRRHRLYRLGRPEGRSDREAGVP